ncbi:hypothetical protein HpVH63_06100 [Helicobacter pylori]
MTKLLDLKNNSVIAINQNNYTKEDNYKKVCYLDTDNITNNRINAFLKIDLTKEKLPSRAKRKCSLNSIIYSSVRPNQRHFGIIKEIPKNFLVSTAFIVIDIIDLEKLTLIICITILRKIKSLITCNALQNVGLLATPLSRP